jgi:hypothetical protein
MFYGVGFYIPRERTGGGKRSTGPDSVGGFTKKYPPLNSELGISRVVPRRLILAPFSHASCDQLHVLTIVNVCFEVHIMLPSNCSRYLTRRSEILPEAELHFGIFYWQAPAGLCKYMNTWMFALWLLSDTVIITHI